MLTLTASAWLYAASVGWFHSSARRTWLEPFKHSSKQRRCAHIGGWMAAALALLALTAAHGLEVAIAYGLGLLFLVAVLSLLVSALMPSMHLRSMHVALGVSLIALLAGLWQVAA